MAIFTWKKGNVPDGIEIKQIYGICFTKEGKILLRIEKGNYQLTGGKPDKSDADYDETLKREFLEEANTVIENPILVGYQLVDEEDGTAPYAQVRMTGLISEIGNAKPDPDRDGNWIYGRMLTSPSNAGKLLGWGKIGIDQVNDAWIVAQENYDIKCLDDKDIIINDETRDTL